jgi:ribokinase
MNAYRSDIVVVGAAYTDCVARAPRLPGEGEDVRGDAFLQLPGGKGLNQAVAAARLGARVAFVGCVGADTRGDALVASLADEGIDTSYIRRSTTLQTGGALVHVDSNGNKQILVSPGANCSLTAEDVAAAAAALTTTAMLMVQLEIPLDAVEAAIVLAADADAKVLLDPAPPARLSDDVLRLVDVLKPNATEAEALTGIAVRDRASAQQAAEKLLDRGVRSVALQAGHEGNLVVSHDGACFVRWVPVERVDTTGAGDAFAAGLAVALLEGSSLCEAARFANAASALAITVLGAFPSMPRRQAVDDLLTR